MDKFQLPVSGWRGPRSVSRGGRCRHRQGGMLLAEIAISNLGVISHASAEFSPGLTVLTGETGAGKTMVVTGLRLLTGGRADASR
ncbi:AAA family ATPase, partial [Xanthomonas citri pv. citri]